MLIFEFLKAKEKALSDTTRKVYQNHLDLLNRFIKGEEPTQPEIIAHLNTFDSPATLQAHKSAIIRYWQWRYPEVNEYGQPVNPLIFPRDTFTPKREEVLKVTTVAIIKQLIDACTDQEDKFFLASLFQLGCRVRELLAVKYSDIIDTGIKMLVKGGKQRVVPGPAIFLLTLRAHGIDKDGIIFPRSYDHYYNLIKRLGEEIGHPEISPHYFRHAYTIDLLNRGLSDTDVAHARGDKNLNMIFRYSGLTEQGLQEQIEKANR